MLSPLTDSVFKVLYSEEFLKLLSEQTLSEMKLHADCELNGGRRHTHKQGGKLNTHLEYSLHPKLRKQRKLNLIIYLNSNWTEEWGEALGLSSRESATKPSNMAKSVQCKFNPAVIFDTKQNSWHGMPEPLTCVQDDYRKSVAVCFVYAPPEGIDERAKALFAPVEEHQEDEAALELIRKRSEVETARYVIKSRRCSSLQPYIDDGNSGVQAALTDPESAPADGGFRR